MSAQRGKRQVSKSAKFPGKFLLGFLGILAIQHPVSAGPPAARVNVRAAASVSGRVIRLRDVAENVSGPLGDVTLGAAPLPGRSCLVSAGEIRYRVRAAGFDPAALSLPASVKVTTTAATATVPAPASGSVTAAQNSAAAADSAGTPLVVTLARPVRRHTVLGPDDVVLTRVKSAGAAGEAFVVVADVVGKRATRALIVGRAVAASDVEEAPVVAANARLTVRAGGGIVEVTISGVACEEGALGQTIRVRLTAQDGTARTVRARIESAETVVIEDEE